MNISNENSMSKDNQQPHGTVRSVPPKTEPQSHVPPTSKLPPPPPKSK